MSGSVRFNDFVIPGNVITKTDVAHLLTEMELTDSELTAANVRKEINAAEQPQHVWSEQFSNFITQNKLNLESSNLRSDLIKELRALKDNIPVVHITFASPADQESLQKIVEWARGAISPQVVLSVGLQPSLVAGVYIRTANKIHDLSMRAMIKEHHGELVKEIGALRVGA